MIPNFVFASWQNNMMSSCTTSCCSNFCQGRSLILLSQILCVGGSWGIWYRWRSNDNCTCNYRYLSFSVFLSFSFYLFLHFMGDIIFVCNVQQHRRLLMALQWRIGEGAVEPDKILFLVQPVLQRYILGCKFKRQNLPLAFHLNYKSYFTCLIRCKFDFTYWKF